MIQINWNLNDLWSRKEMFFVRYVTHLGNAPLKIKTNMLNIFKLACWILFQTFSENHERCGRIVNFRSSVLCWVTQPAFPKRVLCCVTIIIHKHTHRSTSFRQFLILISLQCFCLNKPSAVCSPVWADGHLCLCVCEAVLGAGVVGWSPQVIEDVPQALGVHQRLHISRQARNN